MNVRSCALLSALLVAGVFGACLDEKAPGGQVEINVAPLELPGLVEATFSITVENGAGDVVWSRPDLTSTRYGTGRGDLSYVGPCDAASQPNRIYLDIVSLEDEDIGLLGPSDWTDPTAVAPLVLERNCEENADVRVDFDLTILRAARQGFFDVAVEFSDIFCSAKLDCVDDGGDDLELLHDAAGNRRTTVVMGFACASGSGESTWLHLDDVRVECEEETFWVEPDLGPGMTGARADGLFQTAIYRGRESFGGVEKCYWNLALGVNEGAATRSCTLIAEGSASPANWTGGASPVGAIWPVIHWEVPLTDQAGQVTCGTSAVNGLDGNVSTLYTTTAGTSFDYSLRCGDEALVGQRRSLCTNVTNDNGLPLTIVEDSTGIVTLSDHQDSVQYRLPAGAHVDLCCVR